MAYVLFAVLAPSSVFEAEPRWISDSRIIHLDLGISMIPVTQELHDTLTQQHTPAPNEDWSDFVLSPSPLVSPLQSLSEQGTIAYVEAEYFGGSGEQRCVVWHDGEIVLGPLEESGAINRALRRLGVRKQAYFDEFQAVGLDKHRCIEDWIESAA